MARWKSWQTEIWKLLAPFHHPRYLFWYLAYIDPLKSASRSVEGSITELKEIPRWLRTAFAGELNEFLFQLTDHFAPSKEVTTKELERFGRKLINHESRRGLVTIINVWFEWRILGKSTESIAKSYLITEHTVATYVSRGNHLLDATRVPGRRKYGRVKRQSQP